MNNLVSLDRRYMEFRDKTTAVFARFPQLEPLRYTIFREFLIQPRYVGIQETVKHWIRPFLRSQRTTGALEKTDILIWVEGGRGIMRDTLLPVFLELSRRGACVQLVSCDGPNDLPDQARHFHYPAVAWAPIWAGQAWDALCEAEPQVDTAALRRSFLYHCANLKSLLAEMDRVLEAMSPQVVVTASTQMMGGYALFVAARLRGIRTVLLQHGIVQPFYTPVAAEVMLTWGRSSSDTLERLGVESHKLIAVGSPRHDSMGLSRNGIAKRMLLQELSLEEKRILVFFSNGNDLLRNGAAPLECARWLNVIAEQFQDKLHVIVRLHPNEDGLLYRDCRYVIMTKANPSFEMLMDGCDCVSSLCSTAMYEALLYGKPVWQFYADGWPELADMWTKGFAKRISSEPELVEAVGRMLDRECPPQQIGSLAKNVFDNHGQATDAVANFLISQLH